MKGKFFAPANLMQLEEVLKEQQPYAILAVSTTGLDSANFDEHYPVRVCLKQFEFDKETQTYKEDISFDSLVQAPQAAIDEAIKNSNSYDIFANGGIDKNAYLKGENVLSVEEFKTEIDPVMTVLKQDDITLILNGGINHCKTYLEKIGCADGITERAEAGKAIDQTRLTQEYFQKMGISGKATLENLRNAILPSPTGSFLNNADKMVDFELFSKSEFLKTHSEVSEKNYELTVRDKEKREEKIVGGDNRINVINNFVTKYGRDEKILEAEWRTNCLEADATYMADLSEKGKKKYSNEKLGGKIDTLISSEVLNPEAIKNGESNYQKLMDVALGKNEKKGITIIHSATTGFESGGVPKNTGFPIQFSAVVCNYQDGKLVSSNTGVSMNIEAPAHNILNSQKNKDKFDAFEDAKINFEEYKSGKGVKSREDAIERINEFFKLYPVSDYPLVVVGGTKGTSKSFVQTSMQNLANFSMCEAPTIDFAQIIKEYAYLTCKEGMYPKNILFDEEKMSEKNFSLKDLASVNGIEDIRGTAKKCAIVAYFIDKLQTQQIELLHPEKVNVTEKEETVTESQEESVAPVTPIESTKDVVKEEEKEEPSVETVEKSVETAGEEAFIEEGTYENVTVEKSPAPLYERKKLELERAAREKQDEDFIDNIDKITAGVGGGFSERNRSMPDASERRTARRNHTASIPQPNEAFRREDFFKEEQSSREAERQVFRGKEHPFRYEQDDDFEKASSIEERMKQRRNMSREPREPYAPQEPRERYRTIAEQGVEQLDTKRLIDIIIAQNEMIAKQSATISEQNSKLLEILQEQNNLMRCYIENNKKEIQLEGVFEKDEARDWQGHLSPSGKGN